MKKVLKYTMWISVGIVGLSLTAFGLYAAFNGRRIPELRGLNFLVVPGAICLMSSFLRIKKLVKGYTFWVKGIGPLG